MAAAVRVDREENALISAGPFGSRVAALLTAALGGPTSTHEPQDVVEVFRSRPKAVVASLSTLDPAWCDVADACAHETGTPWLPVAMDHPYLRVGPWTVPGSGPCFRCYDGRRIQHDHQWESSRVLRAEYGRDPEAGPAGHLPQHARLAAGIAAAALEPGGTTGFPPGRVVSVRLPRQSVTTDRVLAIHGCERCREPGRPDGPLRSLRRPVLQEARHG